MWYTPKCQEAMEIADGRSVRDTGREVKRTYRLTRRRETPQTERPGNREVKSLDIDKFILLDRAEARKLVKNICRKKFLTNGFRYGIIQRVKKNFELYEVNSEQ